MILLDRRTLRWSSPKFVERFLGLATVTDLDEGDAVFWSRDNGSVCIEIKSPVDLLNSMQYTGRLLEQMRKAFIVHDHYVLIVQGDAGFDPTTKLYSYPGRGGSRPVVANGGRGEAVMYQAVDNFLTSLSMLCGVMVKMASNESETVQQVLDLYQWHSKPLHSHTTQLDRRLYEPFHLAESTPLVRRWAAQMQGIEAIKSAGVMEQFDSALDMAQASEKDWQRVDGIGPVIAKRAWTAIREKWRKS